MTKGEFAESRQRFRRTVVFRSVAAISLFAFVVAMLVGVLGEWTQAHRLLVTVLLAVGIILHLVSMLFALKSQVWKHGLACPACGIWLVAQSSVEKTGRCERCNAEVFHSGEQIPSVVKSSKEQTPLTPLVRFFLCRLVPLGAIVLGGWMVLDGSWLLLRAKQSLAWPAADGRIVSSSVLYRSNSEGNRIPYASIEYVFMVAGKAHSGDRIQFLKPGIGDFSHPQEIVDQYPEDKAVQVRYHPMNPAVCVLEPGIHLEALFYPAAGLFLIIAAIVLPILLPRAAKQFRKPPG